MQVWACFFRRLSKKWTRVLLLIWRHDLLFAINRHNLVVIRILPSHLSCSLDGIHLKIVLILMRDILATLKACQMIFKRNLTLSFLFVASTLNPCLIDQLRLRISCFHRCLLLWLSLLILCIWSVVARLSAFINHLNFSHTPTFQSVIRIRWIWENSFHWRSCWNWLWESCLSLLTSCWRLFSL